MEIDLAMVQQFLESDPRLSGFEVRREGEELHLEKSAESFARLIPEKPGIWRMEYFHETEEWEIGSFSGTIEECLEYLTTHPHYQFWGR